MLSSEYNWTDEEIENLSLKKLRQKVAAIRERKLYEARVRLADLRLMCSFIAATLVVPEGEQNNLLEEAKLIGIPSSSREKVKKPTSMSEQPGSYERLLQSLAG